MTIKNKTMKLIEERLEDIAELRRMAIIEGCREEDVDAFIKDNGNKFVSKYNDMPRADFTFHLVTKKLKKAKELMGAEEDGEKNIMPESKDLL